MKKMNFMVTIVFGAATFVAGFLLRPLVWPGEERQETTAEPEQETVVEVQQQELSAQELAAQGYLPLETLKVRIDDGEVQWYDGTVWHTAATVEEMAKEDKFYVAQENFREFEEQIKQQLEAHRAEQESIGEQEGTLLVGQKVEPKPTEKPRPTQPTMTAPATVPVFVPEPAAPPEDNGGGSQGGSSGNAGGGNAGGGNSGTAGGGNSGGGNPGGGNTGGDNSGGSNPGGGNTGTTGGDRPGDGNSGTTGGDNPGGGDSGTTGGDNSGGGDTGDGENMEWSDDYL